MLLMTNVIDVGRPLSGDIVEVIIKDHERLERLMRELRDSTSDREAARDAFATVLVAHAEAEECTVYPTLRKRTAVTAHDAEHGKEEHAEGHAALLQVLELKGTDTASFDDALEELAKAVSHHLVEEELSILNPAREELGERARADLGEAFVRERNRLIDEGCGTLTYIRRLVTRKPVEPSDDEAE